jgi:hypothetical protein
MSVCDEQKRRFVADGRGPRDFHIPRAIKGCREKLSV